MKVLVTGGAGFIGSHVVDLLIEKNYRVKILDNLVEQVHGGSRPDYLNPKADFLKGDVRNKKDWERALEGVNAVIHLAGAVGVGQSMSQPTRYMKDNSLGTSRLYELLMESNIDLDKIVMASSMIIYGEGLYKCSEHGKLTPKPRGKKEMGEGNWELKCPICNRSINPLPTPEDKPPQNLSVYGLTKYNQERLAMMYSKSLDVPTISLRPFNVYGPRQSLENPYTGVTAIFSSRIKNDNPPKIYEDGNQTRDFIYVKDAARGFITALESQKERRIYNLGSGNPTSIKKIARTLIDHYGKDLEPRITGEYRPMDLRHCYADTTRIEKELDFKPETDLEEGLGLLVDWGRKIEAQDHFKKVEEEIAEFIRNS